MNWSPPTRRPLPLILIRGFGGLGDDYLYGQDDVLCPVEWGYTQETAVPNVQFFFPAETGHQGQTDQPELFNQLFLEFFRDGKVSRQTADAAGISKNRPELAHLVEQGH